ncbi:tripartite tricarboxylate transporter substrate binding protein [Pusillimonas sp. ANT_WB101]|uniref:tripartite tricarboxylate transporter substrate binding protein n=1 Tax=Pusillimonas sp. ANT_WB101 TaxID=2597356 RepID=UPI0011EE8FE0|nr:tripartite tricarboxylate transporter substrate binding protein [Pusillimonas sp. ANT_WB101]KAA0911605.1 tripartite tricarboxylate transporter substrate binding protein [Pusillimonas sp. ANT_WB101]
MKQKHILRAVVLAAAATLPFGALAQSYSAGKDITVLQGFKAGGGSDALAQLVQPYLAKELGVNFVNRYQPGATGAIAWTQLAQQTKPDGTTVSITNTPMLMTNYLMNDSIKYSIEDLTPLANVVTDPGVMVVGKDSPYKTMQELLDYAKANPDKLTVGNSGVGGDDFFSVIMIEKATGLKFRSVPFAGDGPSWTAAMAGKIDASSNNLGITFPQIKAGNLRVLALYADERSPDIPDVPTLKELGINVVAGSSRGYSAPKGMPEQARKEFLDAMDKVVKNPDFQRDAAARALPLDYKRGDEYGEFLKNQEVEFTAIWNEIKDQYGPDKK